MSLTIDTETEPDEVEETKERKRTARKSKPKPVEVVADIESDDDADDADEAEDSEADVDDTDTDTGSKWRRRASLAALIVALVAALAASGVLGWMVYQDRQLARAGQDAQQAAIAYAQVLTSIDSSRVDENFQQVLDGATGEFKDMYSQSSVQLRQLLIDNNATAHGVVVDSAVQSVAEDKVVVLLFVDQSVTNAAVPDPRLDRSRIRMTMEFVDGRWRTSKVELP